MIYCKSSLKLYAHMQINWTLWSYQGSVIVWKRLHVHADAISNCVI